MGQAMPEGPLSQRLAEHLSQGTSNCCSLYCIWDGDTPGHGGVRVEIGHGMAS